MPQISPIRLTNEQHRKLNDFAEREGRTQADIVREAITRYLDGYYTAKDDERLQERDRSITNALKSMENRYAVLITRLGIDMECLYALAWSLTSNLEDRREVFEQCYQVGVSRWRRKTKGLEREIIRSLLHFSEDLPDPRKKKTDEKEAEQKDRLEKHNEDESQDESDSEDQSDSDSESADEYQADDDELEEEIANKKASSKTTGKPPLKPEPEKPAAKSKPKPKPKNR